MDKENSILALHMGDNFAALSPLLQRVHIGSGRLEGVVNVKRGNILAGALCSVFGFPRQNTAAILSVDYEHNRDLMSWERNFDGLKMVSHFNRQADYLIESLGPIAMSFKAVECQGELHYRLFKTRFSGITIPKIISPTIVAYEKEVGGRYQFSVEVSMFPVGLVVAYAGELEVR